MSKYNNPYASCATDESDNKANDNDTDNHDPQPPGSIKLEPLNTRLQKKEGYTGLVLRPRAYQRELLLRVLEENSIICLGTGLGKTFITVMYLKSPFISQQIQYNKKVVFLAASQDLLKQQAVYFNRQVLHRIKIYCGVSARCGAQIDSWQRTVWLEELRSIDVLFIIHDIFAAAIENGTLNFQDFSAIIFDEIHHASRKTVTKESNHAYAKILRSYEKFNKSRPKETLRPRLIGLTASLFNTVMTKVRIQEEIAYMERLIDGKCVTISEVVENRPKSIIHTYPGQVVSINDDKLVEIFRSSIVSLEHSLKHNTRARARRRNDYSSKLKLASAGIAIKPADFPKILEELLSLYLTCGAWMLHSVTTKLVTVLEKHQKNPHMPRDAVVLYQDYSSMLNKICAALSHNLDRSPDSVLSYARSKPKVLLDVLKKHYEQTEDGSNDKSSFSCVIFATCRLEVMALNSWIQKISSSIPEYSFIKCDYAIGLANSQTSPTSCITKRNPNEQYEMLSDFREGKLNTIVTTAVLEEGIDLPVCSTVIRYNLPQNFRQFIQSRGRARQDVSSIIAICQETEAPGVIKKLNDFHQFELDLRYALRDRDIRTQLGQTLPAREISPSDSKNYIVFGENKIITRLEAESARIIVDRYCNQLARKNFFGNRLQIELIELEDNNFQTILYPPTGCPLEVGIKGGVEGSKELAHDSAIWAFLKALDSAGELREISLMPADDKVDELLASKGMRPNFDDLNKSLEGLSLGDEKCAGLLLFEPELFRECNYLSKNCTNRVYKLIKVAFSSVGTKTRATTKTYFEKPILGMIVDSNDNFSPSILHGHYGSFKVYSYIVSDNLLIKEDSTHNQYLSYTHKLLQDCINCRGISKKEFKNHCLFYMVPLDSGNKPDTDKMIRSTLPKEPHLEVDDIVKFSSLYKTRMAREQKSQLMLVRNVSVMNPQFPRKSFKFEFEPDQPYVEVMPISGEFASTSESAVKQSKPNHDTVSQYYHRKFLESSGYDAPTVFQSYLLPPIIYQLYITTMASNFDRKFVEGTREDRVRHDSVASTVLDPPMVLHPNNLVNLDDQSSLKQDDIIDQETSPVYDEPVDTVMEIDEIASNDSYLEEDIPMEQPALWSDSIVQQTLNSSKPISCSRQSNMLTDGREFSHEVDRSRERRDLELDPNTMHTLLRDLVPLRDRIAGRIQCFEDNIVGDSSHLDDDVEFEKRSATVDRSIEPPIHFDRNTKPFLSKTRAEGLIEALTQRRAIASYDLETLENIGDSYLKYVVSVVLFKSFEDDEGTLTSARSRLTNNEYFTHLAKKSNLGSLAITSSSSEAVLPYILGRQICTKEDRKRLYNRMRPKNLADTFESIVGAYLIYHGEFEAIAAIKWLGLDIFHRNIFDEFHEKAVVFSGVTTKSPSEDKPEVKDIYESCKQQIHAFEEIIGYEFNDKSYLIQAFTHPSSILRCTQSYERLEFLGDALLDILVTITLVTTISTNKPQDKMVSPGQISSSRSSLVNNKALARLALVYRYDLFIQYSNRELFEELDKVRTAMEKDSSMEFLDMLDHDRVVKLLADTFESVAAAIYIDSGFSLDTVWRVYYPMFKELIDFEVGNPTKNMIQCLYEAFPGPKRIIFKPYPIPRDGGDLIGSRCTIYCYDKDSKFRVFKGQGISERQAKQRAVRLAYKDIPCKEIRDRLTKLHYANLASTTVR